MSWENNIRNSLDAYESPLPVSGFEELFSDTSVRRAPLKNRGRLNGRHLLFRVIIVSAVIAIFFQWPTKQSMAVLSPLATPIQIKTPEMPLMSNNPVEFSHSNRIIHQPAFQHDSTSCPPKEAALDIPDIETDIIQDASEAHQREIPAESENQNDNPKYMLASETTSQTEWKQRDSGVMARGIGSSGLLVAAVVLNHVAVGEGFGRESLPAETQTTSLHHYNPLRIGLSVGIPITQKWRFTAGVDYARYSSKLVTSTFSSIQRVYFLGMPIRFDRVIVNNNRFDVYTGIGVEPEVCIASFLSGKSTSHNRFLFAVNSVAGGQLFVTDNISAYIEPTLYWVPSSTSFSPETFHTQSPVSFSLTCGLRFFIE